MHRVEAINDSIAKEELQQVLDSPRQSSTVPQRDYPNLKKKT